LSVATTVQQLLWIETLLKLSAGLVLVLAPMGVIKLLGLPRTDTGFWPRLLGSVLIGLAGALYAEGRAPGSQGLGLTGCVIVNFSAVSMMVGLLALEAGPPSARGRAVVWALVVLLACLSVLEIIVL
jgi:hypothetical protein